MATANFFKEIVDSYANGKIKTSFLPDDVREIVLDMLKNTLRFGGAVKMKFTNIHHGWLVGCFASDLDSSFGQSKKHQDTCLMLGMLSESGKCLKSACEMYICQAEKNDEADFGRFENDLTEWIADYAFGFKDYSKKLSACEKSFETAKKFVEFIEVFGISKGGDFMTESIMAPMFAEVEEEISVEKFDFQLKILRDSGI